MLSQSLLLALLAIATFSRAQNEDTIDTYASSSATSVRLVVSKFPTDNSQVFEDGYIFACPFDQNALEASGPTIYDTKGDVVWLGTEYGLGAACTDLRLQDYEGRTVLTLWTGEVEANGDGDGMVSLLDNSYNVVKTVNGTDLHEHNIPPFGNNTVLVTVYQPIPADLSSVGGPKAGWILDSLAQERDIDTGNVLFNWSAFQHLPLKASHAPVTGVGSSPDTAWDAFHINSIDKGADGNYLISARHLWQIYNVDGSNGDIVWTLGGNSSDFIMGENTDFVYQHNPRWQDNMTKISLFDNGASEWEHIHEQARGLVLSVDLASSPKTAKVNAQYLPSAAVLGEGGKGNYTKSQGSVQLLDSGNVLVGFGTNPWFAEYSQNGSAVWAASLGFEGAGQGNSGIQNYRAFKSTWIGKPTIPPSLNVKNQTDGDVTISVSWNGATQIDHYTLYTGPSPADINPIHNYTRDGFETQWNVTSKGVEKYVVIGASDSNGNEMGRTAVYDVVDGSVAVNGSVASSG